VLVFDITNPSLRLFRYQCAVFHSEERDPIEQRRAGALKLAIHAKLGGVDAGHHPHLVGRGITPTSLAGVGPIQWRVQKFEEGHQVIMVEILIGVKERGPKG